MEKVEPQVPAKLLRCFERYLGMSDTNLHIPLPAKLLAHTNSYLPSH
jgi:hypothetical protein